MAINAKRLYDTLRSAMVELEHYDAQTAPDTAHAVGVLLDELLDEGSEFGVEPSELSVSIRPILRLVPKG